MEDKASQPMPANQSSTTEGESSEVAPPSFIDPRVHFDKTSSKWQFEDYDGREYEWIESKQTWTPIIDESLWAAQQTAYSVDGVNENVLNFPISSSPIQLEGGKKQLKLEKQLQKKNGSNNKNKRMRDQDNNQNVESSTSKGPPQRNTAIYVSRLPLDTNPEELKECFSRAGLILIKLYKDESTGTFNGTALIVFYKSESVDLAIRLFDDASLRLGPSEQDRMQVSRAEFSHKKSTNDNDQQNESNNHSNSTDQQQQKKKKRVAKKEESNKQLTARFNKIVILKHMFTLAELQEDPTLLIDLKEDVREECELLGEVTNVTLYDLEPDGIMSVKFKEPIAAQACILKMNKRFFAGRQVSAFLYDGKYRYKKSGPGTTTNVSTNDTDNEIEEKKRLEEFAKYLEEEQ
ncbi:hypothetical protein KEM48_002578 [Puccinia striiformis f. sp. tritici PST-130]|nr:hypothetical protein KEM48_002578 [Puccinia striiformis f. sp. tritici PST-130]